MQFFELIAKLPDIFAFCVLAFILFNIAYSLWNAREASQDGLSFRMLADWIDPYKQTAFYFHYTKASVIVLFFALIFAEYHYLTMPKITAEGYTTASIFLNWFTYLPNYLIHEFSHRFTWTITGNTFITVLAGNAGETLVPLICYYYLLKLKGGRFLLPLVRFWLATTLFDAGTYMSDARSCKMALTSSDMMTNHAPGEAKGDWYHIFNSLGLLEYDQVFSTIFCAAAVIMLALALYSLWHFFAYLGEWNKEDSSPLNDEKINPEIEMPDIWHYDDSSGKNDNAQNADWKIMSWESSWGNNKANMPASQPSLNHDGKDRANSADKSGYNIEMHREIQRIQGINIESSSAGQKGESYEDGWEDPYEQWKRQQEQDGIDGNAKK